MYGGAGSKEREGQAAAFVEGNYARLAILATVLSGNEHDGADLLHGTLERLYAKWKGAEVEKPWALAKTIMVRLNIDRYRKHRREQLTGAAPDGAVLVSFDHDDRLVEAVRLLPARQRTAVVLRYFEDMALDDIARTMGCSQGTVRSHLSRGLATLRTALSDLEDDSMESGTQT